ncbi:LCP family protein, partial [Aquipuribacter sp. SD81]|uniref:LCP family protein n=1 Tax=Aquipuribacter sp. SD81 TaxID=3127703 RepID=UPI00301814C8
PRGPGRRGPAPRGRGPRPPRRRRRGRGVLVVVLLLVALLVAYPVSLGLVAWQNVRTVGEVGTAAGTPGTTWLLVGSDSRLETEDADGTTVTDTTGSRTDTILLLHTPRGGGPTVLLSLPRDSYVEIPGRGMNKLNASYAFGGPELLTETVEAATGIGVDGYVETGFGGFASVVDALGGVTVTLPEPIEDSFADIDLPAGEQTLQGQDALGLVRTRKTDARGDLARVERQRQVLAAIVDETASPGLLLDPPRAYATARAGGQALAVDDGTGPVDLTRFLLAMRSAAGGDGVQLTVPVSNPSLSTDVGSAVEWDAERSEELFAALRDSDTREVERLVGQWTEEAGG